MNIDGAITTLRTKSDEANELYRLRYRVQELEELLGLVKDDTVDPFHALNISPTCRHILNVIATLDLARKDRIYTLIYGGRPECDQPADAVIDVYVVRIRKYLQGFDIAIDTQRGCTGNNYGWFFTPENKEKLRALAVRLAGEKHR